MVKAEVEVAYAADAVEPLKLERIREEGRYCKTMREEHRAALIQLGLEEEAIESDGA